MLAIPDRPLATFSVVDPQRCDLSLATFDLASLALAQKPWARRTMVLSQRCDVSDAAF